MHFTDTVYRDPYWPTFPLLQITQGCTHNRCKFCTMYKNVPFQLQPMEWIEEDLRELAACVPDAKTIQPIVCIASPRKNTAALLKVARRDAEEAGAETE